MNKGIQQNTEIISTDWESELWLYMSQSNGVDCPIYDTCDCRLQGGWCLSDHKDSLDTINEYIDIDDSDISALDIPPIELRAPRNGKLFNLVEELANKYHKQAGINHPPVPSDLITKSENNLQIEVAKLPMESDHGSLLKLTSCWVVLLNNDDSPARQRFTLYHEIFHILTYEKCAQVSKSFSNWLDGTFIELLADHFAGVMLMPKNMLEATWDKVRDVDRMADIFEVPKSLALAGIHYWNLK